MSKKATKSKSKDKETLDLIEMVHLEPCLWDLGHDFYKDPDVKKRKWKKIAEALKIEG